MRLLLAGLLLALACAPAAEAAINKPLTLHLDYGFDEGFTEGSNHTIVSGKLEATLAGQDGSYGFANTTGARMLGVQDACWLGGCANSASGDLEVVVVDGSGFGLRLPRAVDSRFEADHVMTLLVDLSDHEVVAGFRLTSSLVVVAVGGEQDFGTLGPFPFSQGVSDGVDIVGATPDSVLEVRRQGQVLARLEGNREPVRIGGDLAMASFDAEIAVLPFGDGDTASFRRADPADARKGMDFGRLQEVGSLLGGASSDPAETSAPAGPPEAMLEVMGGVFASAVLHLPGSSAAAREEFGLVRYTRLEVTGAGDGLAWEGKAPLIVQGDDVQGARPLAGFGVFQFPWWSIPLWLAAIGLGIANFSLRRPKKDERWEPYRRYAWIVSPVLALFTLLLWDLETKAIWGVSVTSAGLSGKARLFMLLLESMPLALIGLAVTSPLRMILRGTCRIFTQGSLGALVGPLAYPLSFLFGVAYLRAYIEILVSQVIGRLAG